jgi:hypothetical protein
MSEPNPATANTRVAVEFLTLWMESGDDARWRAMEHITKVVHDRAGPGPDSVIVGLLNLSMLTLFTLAQERGAAPDDIHKRAGDILRDWSVQLPE